MANLITWSGDVTARYPHLNKVNSAIDPEVAYVTPSISRVQGRLSSCFAVPFSSNNVTAKDLMIDTCYVMAGNLKSEEAKEMQADLDARFKRLCSGEEQMMTTSGSSLALISGTVYSTTEDYHPTFGMGNDMDFEVDSARMYDEEQERI